MATEKKTSKIDTIVSFFTLWIARLVLAVLAVAGSLHLLDGTDAAIKYPITIIFVAFLLKETV